jgi:tyrosyl-tRNA synthetase
VKSFLEELAWRGLIHQQTAVEELQNHLVQPGRVGYVGFDPSSDSLTIGNFIPVKLLMHLQQAGHRPIALMGGGTGLIGDPSGRDDERQLLSRERVEANVAGQRRIMERLLDFDSKRPDGAMIVNNLDWLDGLGYIDVLRDIGKHFSVNEMIQKESIKRRLNEREQGISYTEFSYPLLQAYDFLHLRRELDCTVQLAGSDQYGNIVAGIDLIRRAFPGDQGASYGLTAPLVTRSDGKKMSKSTGDAIWLSSDTENATSPYEFYQYWVNIPDADVVQWLKWYTMLEREQIEAVAAEHERAPEKREAQRVLAQHMTELVHGAGELSRVEAATAALFSGELRKLDAATLKEIFGDVPHSRHDRTTLEGDGQSLVEILPQTTLATSKREARDFLKQGAVSVNGERVDPERNLTISDLLHGRMILLRRGKKSWHATEWE